MVVTAVYVVEMLLKIVALGFVGHRGAYLHDWWNWLEMLTAIVGVIHFGAAFSISVFGRELLGICSAGSV